MGHLVPSRFTRVGTPGNHREIITRFDALLRRLGIDNAGYRNIVTMHGMGVAAGWRAPDPSKPHDIGGQKIWNHNAWAVKRSPSWKGDWYVKGTKEEKDGQDVHVPGAEWRSFPTWADALRDYQDRIGPNNDWNEFYVKAYEKAVQGDAYGYWEMLGAGPPAKRYYSDTHHMTPPKFKAGVEFIEKHLKDATAAERAAAESWVDAQAALGELGSMGPKPAKPDFPGPVDPSDKPTGFALAGILAAIAAAGLAFFAFFKK